MALNEFQEFKLDDLYAKLMLSDEDFENWLTTKGLLHGSMQRNLRCLPGAPRVTQNDESMKYT
jgi:hypothetical protein